MSDLSLDVNFEGSGIEVDAEFGYSNTRYVSPSEYTGELIVVPDHERHILETTGKMLNGNVTVEAAPTSEAIFTENGEYLPPEGEVGFRKVEVSVVPDLQPLSVSENGTYQPDGFDGYSQVMVNVEKLGVLIKTETLDHDEAQSRGDQFFWYRYFNLGSGIFFLFFDNNGYLNTNYNSRAVDMICFVTSPDAKTQALVMSRNGYNDPRNSDNSWSWASAGTKIRVYQIPYNLTHDA